MRRRKRNLFNVFNGVPCLASVSGTDSFLGLNEVGSLWGFFSVNDGGFDGVCNEKDQ